ncbi:MAG TPA: Do family serine endopeptidase [Burkholderiales bacterium]|nr:Do family serine endopeptidase [Burkholderiales bacterium]
MRRFWLIFAQTATISLAILFIVSTLKSNLLPWGGRVATIRIAQQNHAGKMTGFSSAAGKAMPSVVNIFTSHEVKVPRNPLMDDPFFRRFFGEPRTQTRRSISLGSGVIVSPEGYILTNHHVIEAADEIEVALADGRKSLAKVVGSDPETDLAVLKIDFDNLVPITFGHSSGVRVGDIVLAIGNPFGVGETVTMGIVSALGRNHLGINTYENFIQTDAAINPGNSGGALVDADGNLVGINTAIYSQSGGSLGIGFAIPVSLARNVMEQIMEKGTVTRGWIGVEVQDISPELADSFKLSDTRGALIAGVFRGGPAYAAGIRPGDILLELDGNRIADSSSMLNRIAELEPGKSAAVKILRAGHEMTLKVTVGRRPNIRKE